MRYRPRPEKDFEWSSKSFTHNVFRVFEMLFGRKYGIRLESTCGVDGDGTYWVIVHTFEAAVAFTETAIRQFFTLPKFSLVKVYTPQLAFAGVPTSHPYLFAIAFDATASGTAGAAVTVTYSHTCTGSNLTLTVEGCQNNILVATASTCTYNAVSMTQVVTNRNTSQNTWMDIQALASPATGANSVVWTASAGSPGNGVSAFSMSLTGTAASPIGASASSQWLGQTSKSQAVTTTQANSVIVDNVQNNVSGAAATGSGQTIRVNGISLVGSNRFYGSTMTTTSVGSYSPGYSWSGSTDGTILVAEIKALAPAAKGGFFFAAAH